MITPVPELYEMTEAPDRDVLDILLLNTLQSAAERHPLVDEFAVSQVTEFTALVSPDEKVSGFS